VQQAIGQACSLDYIEEACKNKTYTKALCVWAWVERPGLVPRVNWVTLPGPAGVPGMPERGRRGLQRRCIIHLDIVEDLNVKEAPMPGRFIWRWKVVDNERVMRDRTERIQEGGDHWDRGRRDEDEEERERDRRGRASSRGWRDAIRHSLSRSGHHESSRNDNGRQRDRSGNRDGGSRRDLGLEVLQPAMTDAEPALLAQERSVVLGMPIMADVLQVEAGAKEDAAPEDAAREDAAPEVDAAEEGLGGLTVQRRGRSRARSASPRASRHCSRAAQTPPSTPDPATSPMAVCPSSPSSKGSCPPVLLVSRGDGLAPTRISITPLGGAAVSEGAHHVLQIVAPVESDLDQSSLDDFDSNLYCKDLTSIWEREGSEREK
jgi:hypothetical protein